MKARAVFWKIDRAMRAAAKAVSYIPPVCLLAVAVVATVNIITTKLFHWGVPSVNDWITYFLIPIVYLSLAYVQLDRGMVAVDFLSSRLPAWFNNAINTVWDLIFSLVAFYIARNMFTLMGEQFRLHKRSSVLAGSFPLWPLALILGVGMALYGVCILWTMVRRFVRPETEDIAAPADGEEKEGDT